MKILKAFLITIIAVILLIAAGIVILYEIFRFKPKVWLNDHQDIAEKYALDALSGISNTIPPSLTNNYIQVSRDCVSFCVGGGPWCSYGLAYSIEGKKPDNGLGGEPRVLRWEKVRDNWYFWGAD